MAVRDFRRLLAVRLAGQCGDGLLQGAMFGAAFFNPDKATSAGAAAAAFAILLLPYSLVGPFAGVVLDRWSRQRILLVSNGLRAIVVALLAASLAGSGPVSTPTVLLALVAISINRFVLSGLSASLPQVVEGPRLVTANAFTTTLGTGATTAGAGASLLLRSVWGHDDGSAGAIASVGAATYLLAAFIASAIHPRRLGPADEAEVVPLMRSLAVLAAGLVEGATHVRAARPAARALLAITAQRYFSGIAFVVVLLVYTDDGYLGGGIDVLGQTIAAVVVGGLVAAVVTPGASRRLGPQRWIVVGLATAGLATGAGFPPYRHWGLVAAGLALGFAAQAVKICVDTLLQESVEDSYRGRVFALYDVLFNVSFVAAAGSAAVLVPDDGHSVPVVAAIAGGYLLTALGYALRVRAAAGREAPAPA
jgi:MFS family permease